MDPIEVELHGRRVMLGFLGKGKILGTNIEGQEIITKANKELCSDGPYQDPREYHVNEKYYVPELDVYDINDGIVAERIYEVLPSDLGLRRPTLDEVLELTCSNVIPGKRAIVPFGLVLYGPDTNSEHYVDPLTHDLYRALESDSSHQLTQREYNLMKKEYHNTKRKYENKCKVQNMRERSEQILDQCYQQGVYLPGWVGVKGTDSKAVFGVKRKELFGERDVNTFLELPESRNRMDLHEFTYFKGGHNGRRYLQIQQSFGLSSLELGRLLVVKDL